MRERCVVCNKELIRKQRKFCSDKCYQRDNYLKIKIKKQENKPKKYCKICGKELSGRHKLFCSKKCRSVDNNAKFRPKKLAKYGERKKICVEHKGGKCQVCGYDKCLAALDFHHVNSKEKDNEIGHMIAGGYSIDEIVVELEKCILLCRNCHAELHNSE